jgi:hypothetical protein
MSSFKLEKGGSAKNQAVQGGVFLAILGVPVAFLIMVPVGLAMILLGVIVAVGGKFASS